MSQGRHAKGPETRQTEFGPQVYDSLFGAWRSSETGHRVSNVDGTPVRQTRRLLLTRRPWLVVMELPHRRRAVSEGWEE